MVDGWMNQAYSRLSTTHDHITDCKLLVCMYWTRLVLVRSATSLLPWWNTGYYFSWQSPKFKKKMWDFEI